MTKEEMFDDKKILLDYLETVRIYANVEFEKLCNCKRYADACIFQLIRDSIDQYIQFLDSYIYIEEGEHND